MQRIQHIAFDFGRILANWDKRDQCVKFSRFSTLSPEEINNALISSELGKMHDSGSITSEEFIRRARVAARLTGGLTDDDFRSIWSSIFTPNPGIEELLARLRPEIGTVVISNTDPIHWTAIEQLNVMRRFFSDPHKLVLSFKVGASKPDRRMWDEGLRRLNLPSDEAGSVLFVDDMPTYVAKARELGFQAERYDCSQEPVGWLEEILRSHRVLR